MSDSSRMINCSVMYPNTPNARFDYDYYLNQHMPLVEKRMGKYLKSYSIEKGVSGAAPGQSAAYVVVCRLVCESIQDFQAGFGPHVKEIQGDMAKYTDIVPTIQFNEIVA